MKVCICVSPQQGEASETIQSTYTNSLRNKKSVAGTLLTCCLQCCTIRSRAFTCLTGKQQEAFISSAPPTAPPPSILFSPAGRRTTRGARLFPYGTAVLLLVFQFHQSCSQTVCALLLNCSFKCCPIL